MKKEVEQALEALNYISGFASFNNGCYKEKLDAIRQALTSNVSEDMYNSLLMNTKKFINQHNVDFDELKTNLQEGIGSKFDLMLYNFNKYVNSLDAQSPQSLEELKQEIIDEETKVNCEKCGYGGSHMIKLTHPKREDRVFYECLHCGCITTYFMRLENEK